MKFNFNQKVQVLPQECLDVEWLINQTKHLTIEYHDEPISQDI